MTLSPLELVAVICAVIALNVGAFYLMDTLPKWLQGPHRSKALAGTLAVFAVAMIVDAAVALSAGRQAANFAFLALMPPTSLMRVAQRASPRRVQYILLAVAMLATLGVIAILLRGLLLGVVDNWSIGLFVVWTGIALWFAFETFRRIRRQEGAA